MADPSKLIALDKAHSLLERVNEAVTKVRQPHLGDLKKQLMEVCALDSFEYRRGQAQGKSKRVPQVLDIALGSTGELETQLRAAKDCRAIPVDTQSDLAKRAEEVGKMLNGLRRRIIEDLGDANSS